MRWRRNPAGSGGIEGCGRALEMRLRNAVCKFGMGIAAVVFTLVCGCGKVSRTHSSGDTGVAGGSPGETTGDSTTVSSASHGKSSAEARGTDSNTGTATRAGQEGVKLEKATFGGGCFWGVEERFRQTPGVIKTSVGYMGGHVKNATYKQVCSDTTGHAEVVQVEFDPARISYDQLLDVFWRSHNPTQMNRQGPDIGKQYRSVIFYHSPEQETAAAASKAKLAASGKHKKPIATEVAAAGEYWLAEDYHQQYLAKRGVTECHAPPGDDD